LVAPKDVEHEVCTEKAISFNCGLISSLIANSVRLYVNDALDLDKYRKKVFLFDGEYVLMDKKPKGKEDGDE